MKKSYITPETKVIVLEENNVITTSGLYVGDDINEGENLYGD